MPHGPRRVARARRLALVSLLLASGSVAIAAERVPAAERAFANLGSELLIVGWLLAVIAVAALYSIERRQRATLASTAGEAVIERRPIERPRERKLGRSAPTALPRETAPTGEPTPPEPPRRRGVRESGEESFRIVEAETTPAAPAPPPAAALEPALAEPPREPVRKQPRPLGPLERCAALRAAHRFDEAAHAARGGLARAEADPGPLLIELSHAELGLGRVNAAIDTARDAHFASRSRESVRHLIWILTETRRIAKEDGDALRRAAARHPGQALLRHAAGVFESLHGEGSAAVRELRAALRLETDPERRRAIERDLARVRKKPVRRRGSERC